MRISILVGYALTILLLVTLFTRDVDIIKEIAIVVSNLVSGYLGYLMRLKEN
jgi:uncharacterized protein YacL